MSETVDLREAIRSDLARYKRLYEQAVANAGRPGPEELPAFDNRKAIESIIAELERVLLEVNEAHP